MPERLAQAFILRELRGLKGKEICDLMGISATNLGVMIHRARVHLRAFYETKVV
jgi:RNA polymerase sigma-70 factor (ECF subfamily)